MAVELRVYALADIHSPDTFTMPELSPDQHDLVVTLGDIHEATLDYIWFMGRFVKSYGVLGNHDPAQVPGFDDLHCKVVEFKGVKIGGFGGGPAYKAQPNHYTEKQVARCMKKMPPVDVFLSHAPPLATSKHEDRVHQGFAAFDEYIARHSPRHWLHGHLQKHYTATVDRTTVYGVSVRRPLTLRLG